MKILIVSQRYWPENFRITDIAETLVKHGNDVTVLTGRPMYPGGFIYEDFKKNPEFEQLHNGVKIIRVEERERKNDIFNRLLNYYSFPHLAKKIIKKMSCDFDVILVNSISPIFSAIPAIKLKKKFNTPIAMLELDLWPESLLAGNIKRNSIVYNYYKIVSRKIYKNCDLILCSTREHIEYLRKLNVKNNRIEYLPQYAEEQFNDIASNVNCDNNLNFVFAGNVGKAQSVETIIKTANLLKNRNNIFFHIIGSGSSLENVKELSENFNLQNVKFYGQLPIEEMPKYYSMADAMLVTLENKPYANITIPGKIQSYLAAGKAILGAASGSTNSLVNDFFVGKCCEAEDFIELANIISKCTKDDFCKWGKSSKELYAKEFNKESFFTKLEFYLGGLKCLK